MRGTVRTVEPLRLFIALITSVLLAAASTPLAASDQGLATWESKVALRAEEPAWVEEPLALCSVRLVEGGSEVAIVCRHDLGTEGEVALIRAGDGERSVAPFWSAPLASPFEATASLAAPALEALLTGELALRIESSASGVVASGGIGTPIFDSGFDEFSLCEWSNFPCPSDGNVCTDEVCSSTGVCSHPNKHGLLPAAERHRRLHRWQLCRRRQLQLRLLELRRQPAQRLRAGPQHSVLHLRQRSGSDFRG
jgi:hypothetical protein